MRRNDSWSRCAIHFHAAALSNSWVLQFWFLLSLDFPFFDFQFQRQNRNRLDSQELGILRGRRTALGLGRVTQGPVSVALELGAGCQECDACAVLAEASQPIHIGWCLTIKAYKLATIITNLYKEQRSS